METVNKLHGLNDTYLKYVSDGLLELENEKLVLNTLDAETVTKICEFIKLNNNNKIIMTREKMPMESDKQEELMHLHFNTFNEMLVYNIYVENIIKYIKIKLKCKYVSVYALCDDGKSEHGNYTIRLNFEY